MIMKKNIIGLSFSFTKIFILGLNFYSYWSVDKKNLEGIIDRKGVYIYALEFCFFGLCVFIPLKDFYINRDYFLIKTFKIAK